MKAYVTRREYADNRFMDKGVELQMNANSWWEAKKAYNYSCMLCCTRGCGAMKCASCPIRQAMLTNAKIFNSKMPKQEKRWVLEEAELL